MSTCSHLHYDHVGSLGRFDEVALLDLPVYRRQVRQGRFVPARHQHWGDLEGLDRPDVTMNTWWPDGAVVDLGGRTLQVHHLPGHSADGMALYDPQADQLFAGDFIYPKGIYAFLPDSDPGGYVRSCRRALDLTGSRGQVLSAHTGRPAAAVVPVMARSDVQTGAGRFCPRAGCVPEAVSARRRDGHPGRIRPGQTTGPLTRDRR